MYGLPKVHKPNFPLRPIIPVISTHFYKLAKFLVPLLRPFSTNTFTINDTFSFAKELREFKINTNDVIMASLKSLFTNIPLDETINIIINKCFASATHYHAISRDQFRELLNLSVKNCHFWCIFGIDGVLYRQVDGVAMVSPLGPLFANIFLSFHEKSWLVDCPFVFKPIFYRRYVDDCFLIFTSRDHVTPFLSYLNSKHSNIQFTHELESNSCLPFLNVKVIRCNGSLPQFIINLLPRDCLPILTVLFQCCTRKVYFSHLSLVISTFALLMHFSTRKWKNSRKPSLLLVILQHL